MWWYQPMPAVRMPLLYQVPQPAVRMPYEWLHRQSVPPLQEQQPYLTTWPYSNVYYGNYFES